MLKTGDYRNYLDNLKPKWTLSNWSKTTHHTKKKCWYKNASQWHAVSMCNSSLDSHICQQVRNEIPPLQAELSWQQLTFICEKRKSVRYAKEQRKYPEAVILPYYYYYCIFWSCHQKSPFSNASTMLQQTITAFTIYPANKHSNSLSQPVSYSPLTS